MQSRSDVTTISEDVTVLSAAGTAAVINLQYASEASNGVNQKDLLTTSVEETVQMMEECVGKVPVATEADEKTNGDDGHEVVLNTSGGSATHSPTFCSLCHIPYSRNSIQIGGANIGKCCLCK
jgi:hypothetical protein